MTSGQSLAWMESTASHIQVLELLRQLREFQDQQFVDPQTGAIRINAPSNLRLGELQGSYEAFYQAYLDYKATTGDGVLLKRKAYMGDISNVEAQRDQLVLQRELQEQEYDLSKT